MVIFSLVKFEKAEKMKSETEMQENWDWYSLTTKTESDFEETEKN